MTNSVPSVAHLPERLNSVRDALALEYGRRSKRPWVIAYSGGKDSTLLLQLVWETVTAFPTSKRKRKIIVVGNDTLVESPLVIDHMHTSLNSIEKAANDTEAPFHIEVTRPAIDQTFWVNVIGRGYIPPTRNFRWCTDRMKILPTKRLLRRLAEEYGGALLLIGTRRAESQNRRRGMDRRRVVASRTRPHDSIAGCRIFSPLADLSDDDVWVTLMQRTPPWGGSHRNLINLYRNAGGGECPLILTQDDVPSCGSSSPRFGCWTCTVVKKDRSLDGLIRSGHANKLMLQELFDFREWLISLRENSNNRMEVRRDGNRRVRQDGSTVLGPFTMKVRRSILEYLRALESRLEIPLISDGEIRCIKDIWCRDSIQQNSHFALIKEFSINHNNIALGEN